MRQWTNITEKYLYRSKKQKVSDWWLAVLNEKDDEEKRWLLMMRYPETDAAFVMQELWMEYVDANVTAVFQQIYDRK